MRKLLLSLMLLIILVSCILPVYGLPVGQRNVTNLIGAYTGPVSGTEQDDNVKAALDILQSTVSSALSGNGGDIYYVDSSASGTTGTSPTNAVATANAGIALCTVNNGDVLFFMPGHAETLTGATDAIDADIAGITMVALGNGVDAATFTYDTTTDEFVIGAAGVTMKGFRFIAIVSNVTMGISVEANGDQFTMIDCVFVKPTTNTWEFADMVDLASGADGFHAFNNTFYTDDGGADTDSDHVIEAGNGVNEDFQFIGNDVQGDWLVSVLWSDTADQEVVIRGNDILNTAAGQHCIEFTAAAVGWVTGNNLYGDTEGSILDSGSMFTANNNISVLIDVDAIPLWVIDNGWNHFIALDGATQVYPENLATDSILAKLMVKADPAVPSQFNNSTDSLEAIRDNIDTLNSADQVDLDAILADTITISGATLPAAPTANSLAAFIASGGTALGTELADSASIVDAIGHTGAAFHTTGVGYWMEKTVSWPETLFVSDDAFIVAGGPILITSMIGQITTAYDGALTRTWWCDAATAAQDIEFTSSTDIDAYLIGSRIVFTNANPAVHTNLTALATNGGGSSLMSPWFCPIGTIEVLVETPGAAAGAITWYMTYVPLAEGVTVTVQ